MGACRHCLNYTVNMNDFKLINFTMSAVIPVPRVFASEISKEVTKNQGHLVKLGVGFSLLSYIPFRIPCSAVSTSQFVCHKYQSTLSFLPI